MPIYKIQNSGPTIHDHTFIAPSADMIGHALIEEGSSIWHGAVIRADIAQIKVGKNSNVQDNAVIHVNYNMPAIIGEHVTIGHGAVVHACTIGNNILIGMNATVLDGAEIGDNCIIGANALIPQGKKIPPGSMVMGIPGKIIRELTPEEITGLTEHALTYRELWETYYSK